MLRPQRPNKENPVSEQPLVTFQEQKKNRNVLARAQAPAIALPPPQPSGKSHGVRFLSTTERFCHSLFPKEKTLALGGLKDQSDFDEVKGNLTKQHDGMLDELKQGGLVVLKEVDHEYIQHLNKNLHDERTLDAIFRLM